MYREDLAGVYDPRYVDGGVKDHEGEAAGTVTVQIGYALPAG